MTLEERKEYMRKWRAEHKERCKVRNRKWKSEHREEYNAMLRKYLAEDLNKKGVKKSNIRNMSGRILEKSHAKLPGYQIHHCFGYEYPEKFIYIPKSLHLKIHKILKDKAIPAEKNHWNLIRELVNSCEEYTYIRA